MTKTFTSLTFVFLHVYSILWLCIPSGTVLQSEDILARFSHELGLDKLLQLACSWSRKLLPKAVPTPFPWTSPEGGTAKCPTHTHLLRNILSNYWCGMHRTCKNTSVKPDRNGWMIGSEKLCEGNLSMSLLEGCFGSDAAQSDCENRTVVWFENCWKTTCRYLA